MYPAFIYTCDKSIEVYEQSKNFIAASEYQEEISNLSWACHSIGDLIPHTFENFGSGHFFPWIQSWEEIQISFNLCLFGLYKQAMVSLRSGLELGLLSVYWNLNDDGHKIIQDWLKSKENTPYFRSIWKKFERHPNFQYFQQNHDIKTRIQNLGFLHDYVHSNGYKFSNSIGGIFKSNFQTFEKKGFVLWYEAFEEVVKVLSILHLIKQPIGTVRFDYSQKFGIDKPDFGGLEIFQVDRLEKLIGQEIFGTLESIAQSDDNVKNVMEWISSLPDMTDEDVSGQIIRMDKLWIEIQGLEHWLEWNKKLYGDRIQKDEAYKQKIDSLIQWAKDNDHDKPSWEQKTPTNKENPI